MSRVIVRFYLNGKCISTIPMNSQDNLKTVREKLKEKISDSQQFLSKDGELIDINDEDSFTIGDIIDSSRIINIKETADKKRIKIKLNDEIISTVQVDTKTKISDIRKSNQNIPETAHFYTLDDEIIAKENEEQFLVEDILSNDEINLKKEKENTVEMDIVTAGIYLNGKPSGERQLNKNSSLSDIRKEIENEADVPKEFVFEDQKGSKIEKDKEQTLKLTSILYDNKINITEKVVSDVSPKPRNSTSLNTPTAPVGSPNNNAKPCRKSNQNISENAHFYPHDKDMIEKGSEETTSGEDKINVLKNEKENTSKMDLVTVEICLNKKHLVERQLNKNSSLSDIRKKLETGKNVPKGFIFEDQKGSKIEKDKEQTLKLTSILYDNKINITEKVVLHSSPSNTIVSGVSPKSRNSTSLNNTISPGISPSYILKPYTSPNNTIDIPEKNIPIKGSKQLKNQGGGKLKIYLYPNEPFNPKDENDAIAILVVGQTGSGKTTLLNSFVNALYGIKITDDFRYIIINEDNLEQSKDQSKSQTSKVSIYNIKRTKRTPPIKIIDTPGFGDTRGIEHDMKITNEIKETFETKVLDLNAICFVAQSSNARLTVNQKYIFNNIINLFGKDVKKNFIAMLTFCDGKKPQAINALQSQDCVFSSIIPEIDKPWYLKFNNSAIYDDDIKDGFTQMFWELGMKSFDEFIEKLKKLPRKSLETSREVLKRREQIKTEIEGLRESVNIALLKMDQIKEEYEKISFYRDKINENKDYKFTVNEVVQKTVDLEGEYATNCKKCNKTCHYPCSVPSIVSFFTMKFCHCIEDGYCNVCGCHHSDHANFKFRYEYVTETKEQTAKEVFERYNQGKEGMANAEDILETLQDEYIKIQFDCYDKQERIKECVNILSSIALNNKVTSSNEYLDMLIKTEEEEKKYGYQKRIAGYKKLKQTNEMIEDIMEKSPSKQSREEIMAELEKGKNELKQGEKSTLDTILQQLRNKLPWQQ
ncbi:hypothetical protein, conserved [Entamoeba dispar SAW760]|uniref:AIG1-type G domain-containing protein n=1 Tax=Entamoeba dispar (strain ATCC PRA-260 / SAW760) TaxID=370354 RepID=B0EB97_ENTDS|nr:uncharacterized protein EDI_039880 [Entamoeba dispar SAW760]EDR28199.1 hypothetical protein, conserved [Entamoeba dispar SAW760]|eukprot:EDR28199.1 hypothetical protein, conserved [Entamoeba dispar SAW760]